MKQLTTKREEEMLRALSRCSDVLAMLHNAGAITSKPVMAGMAMKAGTLWAKEAVLEAQATLKKYQMP